MPPLPLLVGNADGPPVPSTSLECRFRLMFVVVSRGVAVVLRLRAKSASDDLTSDTTSNKNWHRFKNLPRRHSHTKTKPDERRDDGERRRRLPWQEAAKILLLRPASPTNDCSGYCPPGHRRQCPYSNSIGRRARPSAARSNTTTSTSGRHEHARQLGI